MTTAQGRRVNSPRVVAPRRHGPEFSAEKTWAQLSHNISEILNHRASNLSFEENHRFAYNMVLYKHGDMLYKGLQQIVTENLNKLVKERIQPTFPTASGDEDVASAEEEALLKALKQVWDDHEKGMTRLGSVLRYMVRFQLCSMATTDRVHTQDAGVPSTAELIPELFIKHVMKDPTKERLISAILHQVQHERDGFSINRSAVKEVVQVFLILEADRSHTKLYTTDIEPTILQKTEEFYQREGERLLRECNASQYLSQVEGRFKDEDERAHHYLSSSTAPGLADILKAKLLTHHLANVILFEQSGLDVMIDNSQREDLQRLFRLCSMIPSGIKTLRDALKATLIRRGKTINENCDPLASAPAPDEEEKEGTSKKSKARVAGHDLQVAVNWVQAVLSLKDKFDGIWRDDFQSHREIETSMIEGFESFVNMNKKSPEFISLFIDDHLKRGFKGKSDEEVEAVLTKTINLFRYLAEKDVFERYYKNHLAKRLLQGKSVNDDAETGMLAKFKVECGVQFTRKMEGMFRDIKVSEELTSDYHNYIAHTTAPELEIGVIVMTSNCWPLSHSTSTCKLPDMMTKATNSFEKFYLTKHSGRRLTWQLSLGTADLKVRFDSKMHELNVSTFALVILLLFADLGDDDCLSYKEILDATNIDEVELKRHLQSLACAKFKILLKHPSGREIDPDDTFSFNSKFSAPQHKIKIGTISSKVENTEQTKETRERIDEERRHQIDACIVRIMKSRKNMGHNALVTETITQLRVKFNPSPVDIKKRIENLIEREYLERCEDKKSYNYMA